MLKHIVPLKVVQEQMISTFNLERRDTQLKSKEIFFTTGKKEFLLFFFSTTRKAVK